MDFVHPVEAVIPGVQGQVLAVLAGTTAELNLRTIAELAGVSQAQASRVLPRLVDLGIVERREVPPSSLFRLVPEHVAARFVVDLLRSRQLVLAEMAHLVVRFPSPPVSVIVFGSFVRGEADAASDLDVVVVRPAGIDEGDDSWSAALDEWRIGVRRVSGATVEVVELGEGEVAARLSTASRFWTEVRSEGVVVFGRGIDELVAWTGA